MSNKSEFLLHLASYNVNLVPERRLSEICDQVYKRAKRLQKIGVAACNRELTAQEERDDDFFPKEISALLHEVNEKIEADFSGDPRGSIVKILFPVQKDERGFLYRPWNTWGGMESGWGIRED